MNDQENKVDGTQDMPMANYKITGKAETTDEFGVVTGELEIGSIQNLPMAVVGYFVAQGVAELVDPIDPTPETPATPETLPSTIDAIHTPEVDPATLTPEVDNEVFEVGQKYELVNVNSQVAEEVLSIDKHETFLIAVTPTHGVRFEIGENGHLSNDFFILKAVKE